jgi:surface antigen
MQFIRNLLYNVLFLLILTFIFLFSLNNLVFAEGNTCLWTDDGGDNKFSTASNWSGCAGTVPTNGDNLVFAETSSSDNTNEYLYNNILGLIVNNITFSGSVTTWLGTHIDGNEITVNSGIDVTQVKVSDPSVNVYILAPIKLGGNVTITGSEQHNFNITNLNLNGHTLTNNEMSDNFGIVGVISGSGNIITHQDIYIDPGLRNNGPSNTWIGNLQIGSDAFAKVYPGALGSNNSTLTISDGGTLNLRSFNDEEIRQSITMGGSGSTIKDLDGNDVSSGAILVEDYSYGNVTGNVTLKGNITLTSNTAIRSRAITTITGPIFGNYTISFLESSPGPGPILPYCSEYNNTACLLLICSSNNQSLTPNSSNCSTIINTPTPTVTSTPQPTATPKPTATPISLPTVTHAPLPPSNPGNSPISLAALINFILSLRPVNTTPPVPPLNDNYPDANVPCAHSPFATSGTGYWCKNYDWGYTREDKNGYVPPSTTLSSRGYGYRNCTDYVAWKVKQVHNITLPKNWSNAKNWATKAKAANYSVDNTPRVGDIAVWTNNLYGHVAYVAGLNKDEVPILYEFNKHRDGTFSYTREAKADFYIHF